MIEGIRIKENTNLREIVEISHIPLKPVTLLFGGNGAGKSSIIKEVLKNTTAMKKYGHSKKSDIIIDHPLNESINILQYINSENNFKEMEDNPLLGYDDMFNPKILAEKFAAQEISEGQSIKFSLKPLLNGLLNYTLDVIDNQTYFVVLDEIDSGMSVENIAELAALIDDIAFKRDDVQFLIAFNSYEWLMQFPTVFNLYTGRYKTITSYKEFRSILIENKPGLNARRLNNEETGGIPGEFSKSSNLEDDSSQKDEKDTSDEYVTHGFGLRRRK